MAEIEMTKPGKHSNERIQAGIVENEANSSQWVLHAKANVEWFWESGTVVGIMAILTLWALFNDDIRLSSTSVSADQGFEILISISFFLFLAEIAASSFYKDDYCWFPDWKALPGETILGTWLRRMQFGSFYFWLDWISTLSLIFEVIESFLQNMYFIILPFTDDLDCWQLSHWGWGCSVNEGRHWGSRRGSCRTNCAIGANGSISSDGETVQVYFHIRREKKRSCGRRRWHHNDPGEPRWCRDVRSDQPQSYYSGSQHAYRDSQLEHQHK